MKMKNRIFFIAFMLIWVILIISNFIIKEEAFSQQENRYLANFPKFTIEKLLEGTYQGEMDNYINDHFIFRNTWIKIKSGVEMLLRKNRK